MSLIENAAKEAGITVEQAQTFSRVYNQPADRLGLFLGVVIFLLALSLALWKFFAGANWGEVLVFVVLSFGALPSILVSWRNAIGSTLNNHTR